MLGAMAPDDGERHFNLHTTPEVMAGVYANFAAVSHSDYEFTLTFSRVDHEVEEEEVPGVVVARVSLSHRAMRELIDAMEDNWSKWQTREGIKRLPEVRRPDPDQ
jgi:hemerythrin-like domain-containing protein